MKKFKTLLEFVYKEETEHWAISLLKHWLFAKDISKIAKKHWFDCYAKWYPKEKLNYIPTWKTIEIKTVEDIAKLTAEQFEFFIDDLRNFCDLHRQMELLNKTIWVDIVQAWKKGMTWLDTGLNESKINFETSNKFNS